MKKALITVCRDEIAPRFDMSSEVLLVTLPDAEYATAPCEQKNLLLAHSSGEELCDLICRMDVNILVCGAIEEDYYHYLRWKRVELICDVAGPAQAVLARLAKGTLHNGDVVPQ